MPTSWIVFLIWPTVVKGFSSPGEEFSCFPWSSRSFGVAELSSVFFLLKKTPNVSAVSLMGLFWCFSLMMACFSDSDSSIPHLKQTFILSVYILSVWLSSLKRVALDQPRGPRAPEVL